MSDEEIRMRYRDGKDKPEMIKILSELSLKSKSEICKIVGAEIDTVAKKTRQGERKNMFYMTKEIYVRIAAMRDDGLTWTEVAERIGHKIFKSLRQSYVNFGKSCIA